MCLDRIGRRLIDSYASAAEMPRQIELSNVITPPSLVVF